MSIKHTPGPWVVDEGFISMQDQAQILIENFGTDREWCAVGIADDEGFAAVVALCHPNNARLIAAAPDLLEACKLAVEYMNENRTIPSRFRARTMDKLNLAIAAAQETEA